MSAVSQHATTYGESIRAMEALGFSEERARFLIGSVYVPDLDSVEVVQKAIRISIEEGTVMKNDDQKTSETKTIPALLAAMEHRLTERMDRLETKFDRLEQKFDGLHELVTQGFASLGVRDVRRTGTGDD